MSASQQFAASPAEPSVERVATVTLRLAVENNSKFVRGRKRAKENIERYCLEPYGMMILMGLIVFDKELRVIHTITSTFATALSGTTFSNTLGLGAGASQ